MLSDALVPIEPIYGSEGIHNFAFDLLCTLDEYQGSFIDLLDLAPAELIETANNWLETTQKMVRQISEHLGVDIKAEWEKQAQGQWCSCLT